MTWIAQRPFAGRPSPGPATLVAAAAAALLAAGAAVMLGTAALAIPAALAVCWFFIREPLALLTLFLYVGLFKEQAAVEAIPIDVTLALGLLLAAVCCFRVASRRTRRIPVGLAAPVALIGLMLLISLSWTPSPEYGGDKAEKFLTLTLLATLAPFFLIDGQRDVRRFLGWLVAIAVVAGAVALANPPTDTERVTIGSAGNTIGVSQLLCTAAVVLLVGALTDLFPARGWAVVAGLGLVGIAAAVGSRGPILSLALALAATGVLWLARVPRKVLPVLVAVGLGAALLPFVSLPETSAERLGGAVRDPVGLLESNTRYTTFGQAIELIEDDPLVGIGSGGFQSVGRLAYPAEDYPHNLFLEVWSELGLAAVVVLIASIGAVLAEIWRGAWRAGPGPEGGMLYVMSAVLVFTLLAAQVSGDVNENRPFWTVLGLAWLLATSSVSSTRRQRDDGYA
jgi:O-antigen ligase